jgi:hypothetical protein
MGEDKRVFPLSFIFLMVSIYIGILVYTTSQVKLDPISIRYFSPIYAFFFLFVFITYCFQLHPLGGDEKKSGRNLIKIVFYCLVFVILIVHSRNFFLFIDNIHKNRYESDCHPMSAGYETSPAIKKMNAFLTGIFNRQDKRYIVALYENRDGFNYPHSARTHFFRRGLINNSSVSHCTFKKINYAGFVVKFFLKDKRKRIIYRHLALAEISRALFRKLMVKIMQREKVDSVYLIATTAENAKPVRIHEISRYLPRKLKIHYKRKIGKCFVYHIGLKRY